MTLYFQGDAGTRCIGHPQDSTEVFKIIHQFLDEHHYKSYYTRVREHEGTTIYDVGSHSEFFTSIEETTDEKIQWTMT